MAIADEHAVDDPHGDFRVVRTEDAVFVAVELRVFNEQVGALGADAGTVAVDRLGVGKREAADGDAGSLDDKDRFLVADLRPHGDVAHALQREVVLFDGRAILIVTGRHADGVAVLRFGDCRAWCPERFTCAGVQNSRARGLAERGQQRQTQEDPYLSLSSPSTEGRRGLLPNRRRERSAWTPG